MSSVHAWTGHGLLKGALSSFMSDGAGKPLPHCPSVQSGLAKEPLAWLVMKTLLGINGAPLGPVQTSETLDKASWKLTPVVAGKAVC